MPIRTNSLAPDEPCIQACNCAGRNMNDVEIVETCLERREAIRAIKTNKARPVFLDSSDGFEGFRRGSRD